jgi:flagellar protein FlbD
MIKVTRINGKEFVINAEQIEFAEETPDTVISLISGKKVVVSESIDEIIRRVVEYKGNILRSCQ